MKIYDLQLWKSLPGQSFRGQQRQLLRARQTFFGAQVYCYIFSLWARSDYDIILSLCVFFIGAVVAAHAADAVAVVALLAVNGAVDNAADIVDVAVVASSAAVVAADTAEDIAAVAAAVLRQWRL